MRRVDEIQREAPAAGRTSADQSDKFATPEEKGMPVGGGDQLRLQNAVLDGEPSEELVADQEDAMAQNQPLGVMLKIVQNMQEMPKLPEYKPESAPIDLGDWLCLVEPIMADLSDSSQTWWGKVMESAKGWYLKYQNTAPLERLKLLLRDPEELREP